VTEEVEYELTEFSEGVQGS